MLIFRVGLLGGGEETSNATVLRNVERGLCLVCLGSDQSGGGAHGILWTEVDIVLLLPVDPVGPWALPETQNHEEDELLF